MSRKTMRTSLIQILRPKTPMHKTIKDTVIKRSKSETTMRKNMSSNLIRLNKTKPSKISNSLGHHLNRHLNQRSSTLCLLRSLRISKFCQGLVHSHSNNSTRQCPPSPSRYSFTQTVNNSSILACSSSSNRCMLITCKAVIYYRAYCRQPSRAQAAKTQSHLCNCNNNYNCSNSNCTNCKCSSSSFLKTKRITKRSINKPSLSSLTPMRQSSLPQEATTRRLLLQSWRRNCLIKSSSMKRLQKNASIRWLSTRRGLNSWRGRSSSINNNLDRLMKRLISFRRKTSH